MTRAAVPPPAESDVPAAAAAGASPRAVPGTAWVLLICLTFAWGAMWPLMKLTLTEIPLLTFRAGSAACAGTIMLCVAAATGLALRPAAGEVRKVILCAGVNVSLWFFLSALAVTYLPAGRAALLAYTMPLWALVIGVMFLKERLTARRCVGVAAGIGAVLVFAWDDLGAAGQAGFPVGIVAILLAALTWGVGSTLQKQFNFKTPVTTLVAWQFVLGSLPLMALALGSEDTGWVATVSGPVIAAAAGVTVISQAFGLWCWSMILKLTDMAFASIAVLTVPMMSQVLSFLFLGEPFGPVELAGLLLITFGLATVLPLDQMVRRLKR